MNPSAVVPAAAATEAGLAETAAALVIEAAVADPVTAAVSVETAEASAVDRRDDQMTRQDEQTQPPGAGQQIKGDDLS